MDGQSEIRSWKRISVLGSGGFGTVTLWRCSETNDTLAIKMCKSTSPSHLTKKQTERWHNEVEIMKQLSHPNVVKYKTLPEYLESSLLRDNHSKLPLLSMEYCNKGNLRHLLTQPVHLHGLPEETVKCILQDINNGIEYLHHNNITHRDIKPDNIVLQDFPSRKQGIIYKIIDLGYAKELGNNTASCVGTFNYLAPEILVNKRYDKSVDFWSFGILTFEILCGVIPFPPFIGIPERYQMVKAKGPKDICVRVSADDVLSYSNNIFRGTYLNPSFKHNIEIWLQKVLQFDPIERSTPFLGPLNVFEQMNWILQVKYIYVFSIYNYQFYVYECNSNTTIGDLKEWIITKSEIEKNMLLLIGKCKNWEDTAQVEDVLENDVIFALHKSTMFNIKNHNLPELVKIMFEHPSKVFRCRHVHEIYVESIYFINQEIRQATILEKALKVGLEQINFNLNKIETLQKNIIHSLSTLGEKINVESLYDTQEEVDFSEECMKRFITCASTESQLRSKLPVLMSKVNRLEKIFAVTHIGHLPEFNKLLDKAVKLVQLLKSKKKNENVPTKDMLLVISRVIKIKDSIINNPDLSTFHRCLNVMQDHSKQLLDWVGSFHEYIELLIKCHTSRHKQKDILESIHEIQQYLDQISFS